VAFGPAGRAAGARPTGVLRDAVAERPVFLDDFDEADDDVGPRDTRRRGQRVRDLGVKRALLFDRPAGIERDPDDDDRTGMADAQIFGRIDDLRRIGAGDDLKFIIDRDVYRFDECPMHGIADRSGECNIGLARCCGEVAGRNLRQNGTRS